MRDPEIGRTIAHAPFNILAFDAPIIDFNPDVGVPNRKRVDDGQQKMSRDTLISCQSHDSGQGLRFRWHRALRKLQNLARFENYFVAYRSGSCSGSRTLEQLIGKRTFQCSDRMANAGLGAAELRRSSSKAARISDGD